MIAATIAKPSDIVLNVFLVEVTTLVVARFV